MLIFDFDGVLLDSIREIVVTAYNMARGTLVTRLDQLPQNALELFLRNRFHVQPIENPVSWSYYHATFCGTRERRSSLPNRLPTIEIFPLSQPQRNTTIASTPIYLWATTSISLLK